MGRNKKPTALKLLEGTARADRLNNEPKPKPIAQFQPPDYFDAVAREHWDYLRPKLEKLGCLCETDMGQFISLCSAYSRAIRAERQLAGESLTIRTDGKTTKNPAIQIARDAWKQYSDLSRRFGLDPASRGAIDLPASADELDPMEALLRGHGG